MVGLAVGSFVRRAGAPGGRTRREQLLRRPRISSELNIAIETPPGSNLDVHAHQGRGSRDGWRGRTRKFAYTYTTIGGQNGDVDNGNIYVRLVPKGERDVSAEDFGRAAARGSRPDWRARRCRCSRMISRARRSRSSSSCAAARSRQLNAAAGLDRRAGETGSRGSRCRIVDEGTEAGARGRAQSRSRRHARRHSRSGRAVAAAGVCGNQGGRLGGSQRRDARSQRQACARGARQRAADLDSCRS